MVWVRSIFGFVLIAMAVYFVRPLFPDSLLYFLTLATVLFIGGIFMAWLEPTKLPGKVFSLVRHAIGMIFFVAALLTGASGIRAYVNASLAEAGMPGDLPGRDGIRWRPGADSRLEQAAADGLPVFIDFYADWCIPCKELDEQTFSDPEVVELSRRFVMLKVDLTGSGNPAAERLRSRFQVKGVPTLVLLRRDGTEAMDLREVGFIEKDVLLEHMHWILRE